MVVHNAGKNFAFTKFKQLANSMTIKIKKVSVEAYNSIGLVKRYYASLQYVYKIIRNELKDKHIDKEIILQMAIKAVNNSAGFNGIISTLFVFGTYP